MTTSSKHSIEQEYWTPSGYRVRCECGEEFRGIRCYAAVEAWGMHFEEERANRGLASVHPDHP